MFASDGSVLTRLPDEIEAARILQDGRTLLKRRDLRRGARSLRWVHIAGFDEARDGLLAIAVYGERPAAPLQFWRGHKLVGTVTLHESPLWLVEFAPNGNELVVSQGNNDLAATLVNVRTLTQTTDFPPHQHAFAWSPDGHWFALATEDTILIYGAARDQPVYTLPLGASGLTWRR